MGPERIHSDGQTFGFLFESLCIHDLRAYTACLPDAHPESLRHYGDSDGLEVDAIIRFDQPGSQISIEENASMPKHIGNAKFEIIGKAEKIAVTLAAERGREQDASSQKQRGLEK